MNECLSIFLNGTPKRKDEPHNMLFSLDGDICIKNIDHLHDSQSVGTGLGIAPFFL